MDHDVIIVGAGLAGLSAGAYLSKQGKNVLIIEQHNIVGGSATHFTRQREMRFEVGLHEMDTVGSDKGKHILQSIGVWDRLQFIRVPEFYRVLYRDIDIVVPDDMLEAKQSFLETFPQEHEAIDKYFEDLIQIREAIKLMNSLSLKSIFKIIMNFSKIFKLLRFKNSTVAEYLEEITDNFGLKVALTANMGYFHDDASELSMLLFAAGQSSYMSTGGWFIKGGSQMLSNALADVIKENGGSIITKHKVEEIIVKEGIAKGVKYRRLKRPNAELRTVFSNYVIYNGGIPLITSLIPSLAHEDLYFMNLHHGVSLMTIYISFKEPVNDLTDDIYSTFVIHDDIDSFKTMTEIERSNQFSKRGFVFVDYGVINSGLENDSHYTGVICGFDYLSHWQGLDKKAYKKKKVEVQQAFLESLNSTFPGIKDRIQYAEMATAKTIKRYTLNPSGTVYGFAPTTDQFMTDKTRDIRRLVKNLEFASAWSYMGGFSPALSGGRRVAKKVLKELQ